MKKPVKRRADPEHQEQASFVMWVNNFHPHLDGLWWATPNGGKRDIRTAVKLKAEGVRSGVPDVQFMVPKGIYHGLFIEFKRPDGKGKVSDDQSFVMGKLTEQGYYCDVANTREEAISIFTLYFDELL